MRALHQFYQSIMVFKIEAISLLAFKENNCKKTALQFPYKGGFHLLCYKDHFINGKFITDYYGLLDGSQKLQ